jgi:hypothetical protein
MAVSSVTAVRGTTARAAVVLDERDNLLAEFISATPPDVMSGVRRRQSGCEVMLCPGT